MCISCDWPALQLSCAIASQPSVALVKWFVSGCSNFLQNFQYIREFTDRPMNSRQAVLANVAKSVVDTDAGKDPNTLA